MKVKALLSFALIACFLFGATASAHGGYFLDGHNIYAVPKPLGNWNIHLVNADDPSLQGNLHIVWTTCDRGVGMMLTAPQAMPSISYGVMSIYRDGVTDAYRIPIESYQLGFCWALAEWPEPWAFERVYFDEAQTMPAFVEWTTDLGYDSLEPWELYDSLHGNGGHVIVEYFDASGAVVLAGEVK